MELISLLVAVSALILIGFTILMPVFVYQIHLRSKQLASLAKEQMEWNKCQLEAQNLMLKELYNIRTK